MPRPAGQLLDQAGATLRTAPVELPGKPITLSQDLLEPNPWNPNQQDAETFAKEKVSLQRFGFVVPIIVRPAPNKPGIYQIIDGEHRLRAGVELGMEHFPCFDIGPVSDHEAMQLTVILNELRGKPEERKLGEVLKRLLASDTLDRLTEVMPYTKEQFGQIAKLPEFDWDQFRERNQERAEKRWVERIFRLPPDAAATLNRALTAVKQGEDMSDGEALGVLASEWLER
jgi:hypothetical protein